MLSLVSCCFTSSGASDRPATSFPTCSTTKLLHWYKHWYHKNTTHNQERYQQTSQALHIYSVSLGHLCWPSVAPILGFLLLLLWLTIIAVVASYGPRCGSKKTLCGTFTTDGDLFTFVFTTQNSLSLIFTFGLQTLFYVLCCGLTMIDSCLSLMIDYCFL